MRAGCDRTVRVVSVETTPIDGLLVVHRPVHDDARGFFRETYRRPQLEEVLGRPVELLQGNHSRSAAGVVRGFHAEPWDKLVDVVRGTALCAVADVRPDSPTFAQVVTFELGDPPGERAQLFISAGLGNAFCAVTEVDYVYDVGGLWEPDVDSRAIRFDDPDLDVDWPVAEPTVSEADQRAPTLRQRFPHHPRWA